MKKTILSGLLLCSLTALSQEEYYRDVNGRKLWKKASIETVDDFATYTNGGTTLTVTDTVRGGSFMRYYGSNPADNGLIFADANGNKWKRITDVDYVDIRWFGGQATLFGFDNSEVFAAAEASARVNLSYPKIKFPNTGTNLFWNISDSIKISSPVEIFGDSKYGSKIMFTGSGGFYFDSLATGSYMHDLFVRGVIRDRSLWNNNRNGITIKCWMDFKNVVVSEFEGSGFYAVNDLTNSWRGNSNFSSWINCESNQNRLHGFYFEGGDANAMLLDHCSMVANGAAPVYDKSFLGNHYKYIHTASNSSPELTYQRGLCSYNGNVYGSIKDYNSGNLPTNTAYWQNLGTQWISFPNVKAWHTDSVYFAAGEWILEGINQYGTLMGCYAEKDQPKAFIDQRNTDENSNADYRIEAARLRADNFKLFSDNPIESRTSFNAPDMFVGGLSGAIQPPAGYNTLMVGSFDKSANIELWNNGTKIAGITTTPTRLNITADTTNVIGVLYNNGSAIGGGSASFASVTGQPTDNANLATALNGKLGTTGNGSGLTGLTKSQVGLSNVDNTSDANKPVSIATQAALDAKPVATYVELTSNVSNSTTTLADITGLSFTAQANSTYEIELFGAFQSAATTTGIAVALDIPNGSIIGMNVSSISATANGGTYQLADNAVKGNGSASVATINENVPIKSKWIYVSGAGGTVQARLRSEIASSQVTLQANLTWLSYKKIK